MSYYVAPFMNIKDAAEYLGVSIKTVERYVAAKELSVTYLERGKRDFLEEELARFKQEREQPTYRPAITTTLSDIQLSQSVLPQYLDQGMGHIESMSRYFELGAINYKKVLNLEEAAKISGLSINYLRGCLKSGKLEGRKLGRGWKVRIVDLDKFVGDIFKS